MDRSNICKGIQEIPSYELWVRAGEVRIMDGPVDFARYLKAK
jgi:hypothetical protein